MDTEKCILKTRIGFENSFEEINYYNLQTQDDKHLSLILNNLDINVGNKVLDLGTGSGYLAFPIAKKNPESNVIGLDIVTKILEKNNAEAKFQNLRNIKFISYNGIKFPFEDNSFDIIVTRYSLHHFPLIKDAFSEISRVLKKGGQLFLSDPIPIEIDSIGFVDAYMQMKQDNHVKFYTENEFTILANDVGLILMKSYQTEVRFPRKEAYNYIPLIKKYSNEVVNGYKIQIIDDEIFITEKVINLSFIMG